MPRNCLVQPNIFYRSNVLWVNAMRARGRACVVDSALPVEAFRAFATPADAAREFGLPLDLVKGALQDATVNAAEIERAERRARDFADGYFFAARNGRSFVAQYGAMERARAAGEA